MRGVWVLAAGWKRDAEQMSSVLHVVSAIERMGNAAVDIARVVTHHLGIPASLVADLAGAGEVSHRVRVRAESRLANRALGEVELPVAGGVGAVAIRRGGAETIDASGLRGRLHLGAASEEVGDAAQQLVWLVEQEEEMHPILAVALGEADEVFVQYPIGRGSALDGAIVEGTQIGDDTGFHLLAIRREGRYFYRPRRITLAAGDEILATGPPEGRAVPAEHSEFRFFD